MTASELFAPHPGDHCAEPVSPAVAVIRYFRRLVRQWRRREAVPAVAAAGAAPAGPLSFREAFAWHEITTGEPVLTDQMLSEVRDQWNSWHDELPGAQYLPRGPRVPTFTPSEQMHTGEFAVLDAKVDAVLRPVNGRSLGTQPRRHPELNREFTDRPGRDVLERVIAGLRKLPVYGEKPQLEVDKLYRNGWQ